MKKRLVTFLLILGFAYSSQKASQERRSCLPQSTERFIKSGGKVTARPPHCYHATAITYLSSLGKSQEEIRQALISCSSSNMQQFAKDFERNYAYSVKERRSVVPSAAVVSTVERVRLIPSANSAFTIIPLTRQPLASVSQDQVVSGGSRRGCAVDGRSFFNSRRVPIKVLKLEN